MSGPLPDPDHLRFLLDQVDQRMKVQRDEWDGLDRKATTILATTGIVLGLVVNNADALGGTPAPGPTAYFLAVAALVGALIAGVVALVPRRFSDAPEPLSFLALYAEESTDHTVATLTSTKAAEFTKNGDTVRSKLLAVRVQMALIVAAGVLLAVVLVIMEVT